MAGRTKKSGENVVISKKELQKLIKKGEKTGSLSFAELNDAISDDLKSLDQIEDVVIQFKELGIKLVDKEKEKAKKKATVKKQATVKKKTVTKKKTNTADKKNKLATKTAKTGTKKTKTATKKSKAVTKKAKATAAIKKAKTIAKNKEEAEKRKAKEKEQVVKDLLAPKKNGSDIEFGTVTDPVKMYLKEMGMVTLLSREGEIEIAKKIEKGEHDILRAMLDTPIALFKFHVW